MNDKQILNICPEYPKGRKAEQKNRLTKIGFTTKRNAFIFGNLHRERGGNLCNNLDFVFV